MVGLLGVGRMLRSRQRPEPTLFRISVKTNAETPIFADGFESVDTTAWSSATP